MWCRVPAEVHSGILIDQSEALHTDGVTSIGAEYAGPELPDVPEDESIDFWGMRRKSVTHHGDTHMEQYFYPLAEAQNVDDLDALLLPQHAARTGASTLVGMGIDILNPVQWTCPGMDMVELKAEFGARICFHGAIDNQHVLPFGTEAEVRAEVRHCIDELASDGTGYILAPCHNIQGHTPLENMIAMYDEAQEYGAR